MLGCATPEVTVKNPLAALNVSLPTFTPGGGFMGMGGGSKDID